MSWKLFGEIVMVLGGITAIISGVIEYLQPDTIKLVVVVSAVVMVIGFLIYKANTPSKFSRRHDD